MRFKSIFQNLFIDKEFKRKVEFFKKLSIFSGLSNRVVGDVVNIAYEKKYPANEIIFSEGSIGKGLFIIKSGEVVVIKGKKILSKLHSENFFGEMTLLEEMPRSATAKTTQESEFYLLYKANFDGLVESNPRTGVKIMRNLTKILSRRLRKITHEYTKA